MGGLGPFAKHMQVESPELTEADSEDGEPVGQMDVQLSLTETAMAWNHTELNMDVELIKYGAAEEEMHLLQTAGEGNEKTEVISMQDSVICEAWHRWEDSLRMAHSM